MDSVLEDDLYASLRLLIHFVWFGM